jgi:hypothetical protein
MSWSGAAVGVDDSGPADFAAWFCDPEVNSIFIQLASTWCTSCPERMAQIAELREHWETYGARWIFIINDTTSGDAASAYVERYGITFGWRTGDTDNSEGPGTLGGSSLFAAVPWTGVIRRSDMTMVYDEPDTSYLDIQAIAVELAAGE